MRISHFGTEFQSRPVGHPHRRNAGVIQSSRKFIQAGYGPPARRNQFINSNVENARRLAQAQLQSEHHCKRKRLAQRVVHINADVAVKRRLSGPRALG